MVFPQDKMVCTTSFKSNKFKVYFFDFETREEFILETEKNSKIPFDKLNNCFIMDVDDGFTLPFYENQNYEIHFPIETHRRIWDFLIEEGFKRIK
jgi:hypothetical protein